jgi:hypothetical protein
VTTLWRRKRFISTPDVANQLTPQLDEWVNENPNDENKSVARRQRMCSQTQYPEGFRGEYHHQGARLKQLTDRWGRVVKTSGFRAD